jgi:hypothetical protein
MIYFFLFYNKAEGKQSRFAFNDDFKHCNVLYYEKGILVGMSETGIKLSLLKCHENSVKDIASTFKRLESLTSLIIVDIKERKKFRWFPWWVRSCNELCRYISGIDIGFTFNPVHLYNKLIKYSGKKYEIIYAWRR